MNRRDFLIAVGAGILIYIPAAPALALLPSDSGPTSLLGGYPDEQIIKIISQVTTTGNFSQTVTRTDGQAITYRFAWAVGIGSLHYKGQYRKHFGEEEPSWALLEHPYHQFRLYKESVVANLPLPGRCPNLLRSDT
jgi:hypothetical protein